MATNLMWILSVLLLFLWGSTPTLAQVCDRKHYNACLKRNTAGPCMFHADIVDCLEAIPDNCTDSYVKLLISVDVAFHRRKQDNCPNIPRRTCYEILPELCTANFPNLDNILVNLTLKQIKQFFIPQATCNILIREEKMRRACLKKFETICGSKDAKKLTKKKIGDLNTIIKACKSAIEDKVCQRHLCKRQWRKSR